MQTDQRIRDAFLRVKSDMNGLYQEMINLKEEIKSVREFVRQNNTRNVRQSPRKELNSIEKKALKLLDITKLKRAITHYIEEGYTTEQMKYDVMNRFDIGKTCFYKYLNIVRQTVRGISPQDVRGKD